MRVFTIRKTILLLLILIFFIPSSSFAKKRSNWVDDIRFWSYKQYTRVVVVLTNDVKYSKHEITKPARLYFDLKNTKLKPSVKNSIAVKDNLLQKVRIAQFNKSTVRVVLDLKNTQDYRFFTLSSPDRLVIDIFDKKEKKSFVPARKVVVIDAGHGGSDPGAIGKSGLKEKDVVLDISLKLAEILREKYLYEVFLTRDKDTFISLEERTAIANSKSADVFVSVHANASKRRGAKGIETYFLNWTNNKEAIKVAARENAISEKKMAKVQSELGGILVSLARETKRDESLRLAHYVQKSIYYKLLNKYKNVNNLGVKQALFYVLIGASMPSVLVEVSFITNPNEERLLKKGKYKKDLAYSIAKGINMYISTLPDAPKYAKIDNMLIR